MNTSVERAKKILEKISNTPFTFDAASHTYHYQGQQLRNVTDFVGSFSEPFNADYYSEKKAGELWVRKDQIQKIWLNKGEYASTIGSEVHEWIENFYHDIFNPIPDKEEVKLRVSKFIRFWNQKLYKAVPIAQEIRIFSPKYGIAGTFDALFLYKGNLIVFDWKTNQKFDEHKNFKNLLSPFHLYPDNHLTKYSIQISLYRLILAEWGIKTKTGVVIWIGPRVDDLPLLYEAKNFVGILKKYLDENHQISLSQKDQNLETYQ